MERLMEITKRQSIRLTMLLMNARELVRVYLQCLEFETATQNFVNVFASTVRLMMGPVNFIRIEVHYYSNMSQKVTFVFLYIQVD